MAEIHHLLDDAKINELLNANMEYERLDYKLELDINSKPSIIKIAKDMAAMSNSGGGHIIIGVNNNFEKIGLDLSFKVDDANLRNKVNSYFDPKIDFLYREVIRKVNGNERKFAAIYVQSAIELVMPKIDGNYHEDGKQKIEFRRGDILIRNGSESKVADTYEVRRLLEKFLYGKATETRKLVTSVNKIIEASAQPDKVKEMLPSNLLPIKSYPVDIWEGSTEFRTKGEAHHFLNELGRKGNRPPFILKEQKLYTFSNLTDPSNPLRALIDKSTITSSKTVVWRNEEDRWRWVIELLNVCLNDYCRKKELAYDGKYERFFFPILTSKAKKISWRSKNRRSQRQVAAYYEKMGSYLHRAVRMRFITLGEKLFLLVDPRIMFTSDGMNPATGERFQRLATRLTYNQFNSLILNDVKFWSTILSNAENAIQIQGLGYEILIDTSQAFTEMNVGYAETAVTVEPTEFEEVDLEETEEGLEEETEDANA